MRWQAVLFDLDGTLIDSAPDLGAAADKMRTDRGMPSLAAELYRPLAGAGARGMLEVAFGATPEHPEYEALRGDDVDIDDDPGVRDALAFLLRSRGLKSGDRLAFFLQNRIEVIDLWLAGVKLGLIVVPVNVLYRERELRHILTDSAPTAVVTSADLAGFIPAGAASPRIWRPWSSAEHRNATLVGRLLSTLPPSFPPTLAT